MANESHDKSKDDLVKYETKKSIRDLKRTDRKSPRSRKNADIKRSVQKLSDKDVSVTYTHSASLKHTNEMLRVISERHNIANDLKDVVISAEMIKQLVTSTTKAMQKNMSARAAVGMPVTSIKHLLGVKRLEYDARFCELAETWGALGLAPVQIAAALGISVNGLAQWADEYPDFLEAMRCARTNCASYWLTAAQSEKVELQIAKYVLSSNKLLTDSSTAHSTEVMSLEGDEDDYVTPESFPEVVAWSSSSTVLSLPDDHTQDAEVL